MRTMIYRIFPSHLIRGHNLTHLLQWICFHTKQPSLFKSLASNPNLRKSPEIRRFLALIYLFLTSKLPSRRGSSGYAECLCHFLVYGNKSTAVSLFEPFAGICLLTFTYKNHVRMNYKLIGIGSNYFIILLYRIIRNMCNKVFIGIFSTLSLCHKYAWCDRH